MGDRAREFVDRWEFDNVEPVAASRREDEARRLAAKCRVDAASAGIEEAELDAAVDGDLIGTMFDALGAAAFRQLARDQWADDEANR